MRGGRGRIVNSYMHIETWFRQGYSSERTESIKYDRRHRVIQNKDQLLYAFLVRLFCAVQKGERGRGAKGGRARASEQKSRHDSACYTMLSEVDSLNIPRNTLFLAASSFYLSFPPLFMSLHSLIMCGWTCILLHIYAYDTSLCICLVVYAVTRGS